MFKIKPPLFGEIELPLLRSALLEHLGLVTEVSPDSLLQNVMTPEDIVLRRHLRLLAFPRDTERVKYREQIEQAGGGNVFRLMGTLHFDEVYSKGFIMNIYGKDIARSMTKKVFKFQKMLSGTGTPPFAPHVIDTEPRFVSLIASD